MIKIAVATVSLIAVSLTAAYWYRQDSLPELPALRTARLNAAISIHDRRHGHCEPEEVVDVGAQVAGKIQSLGIDPRDPNRVDRLRLAGGGRDRARANRRFALSIRCGPSTSSGRVGAGGG